MLRVYRHSIANLKKSLEAHGEIQSSKNCSYNIRKRPRSRVTTRGQDHYIILKHLRVRLKSIIPNVRQTNVFISYNQNIILGKHIEPSLGVLTRNLNKLIFW